MKFEELEEITPREYRKLVSFAEKNPGEGERAAMLKLGELVASQMAEESFEQLPDEVAADFDGCYTEAMAALKQGQADRALMFASLAVKRFDDFDEPDPAMRENTRRSHMSLIDHAIALLEYRAARPILLIDPRHLELFSLKALAQASKGALGEASLSLGYAIGFDPVNCSLRLKCVDLDIQSENSDGARMQLAAIFSRPTNAVFAQRALDIAREQAGDDPRSDFVPDQYATILQSSTRTVEFVARALAQSLVEGVLTAPNLQPAGRFEACVPAADQQGRDAQLKQLKAIAQASAKLHETLA